MSAGRRVRDRRPARHLRNRFIGEDEHPGFPGVPITGEQHRLRLPLQGGNGDLRMPFLPGFFHGVIQPPQVHVRRHDERHSLKEGVPGGRKGGLILRFQRGLCEPAAVIRDRHDLELYRSRIIAGEQMYRELKAAVGGAVGNELCVCPRFRGIQLRQNITVTLPRKDKRPWNFPETGGLIGEGIQFVYQGQLADTGADIVHSAEQVTQAGNGRNAGAAPGVRPTVPCKRRKKQGRGFRQFCHCCGEGICPSPVCGQNQTR